MITGSEKEHRGASFERIPVLITSWPFGWDQVKNPCALRAIFKWHQLNTRVLGRCLLTGLKLCVEFLKTVLVGKVLNIAETPNDWPELNMIILSSRLTRGLPSPQEYHCSFGMLSCSRALSKCPVWAEVDWMSRIDSHIWLLCLKEVEC